MTDNVAPTQKKLQYQVYLEERKRLADARSGQSHSFDKAVLTLAAGALGLSITFIRQIAPSVEPSALVLLLVAWISLCLSILSTLISFMTSQSAYTRQLEILEMLYSKENSASEEINTKNLPSIRTGRLNVASIVTFTLGVVFLATFSALSLTSREEATMSNAATTGQAIENQGGQKPPKPPKPPKPDERTGDRPPNPPKPPPSEK